ncbi:MAG: ABC transporter ATP-binding protein [Anaerolineales bacterium]|nr:ABC transporter ATP-binding protein [Anaerolineales bacterium]
MMTIEADGLTRDYDGMRAVDGLTFGVAAGECFGFLGPNGAGKTTTIRMLTGQLRPTAGRAHVCGYDVVTQRQQLKPAIGVVFEQQNLYARMTATENLRFMARLYGVSGRRVPEVLRQVGLGDAGRKKTAVFSNGMKQRLLIARALLHRPRVLFLDEPTKGLDPGVAREIRAIVQGLRADGVTVFLTTHYMAEADRLCDRVAILHQGRIATLDTPAALKQALGRADATLEDVFLAYTGHALAEGG